MITIVYNFEQNNLKYLEGLSNFLLCRMHSIKNIFLYFYIKVSSLNSLFVKIFLASFPSKGILNMDPTVWLDGARHANTCIPPSFPRNAPAQQCSLLNPPKNTFASIKNCKIQWNHIFNLKIQGNCLANSLLATVSSLNTLFYIHISLRNSV